MQRVSESDRDRVTCYSSAMRPFIWHFHKPVRSGLLSLFLPFPSLAVPLCSPPSTDFLFLFPVCVFVS